MSKFDELKKQHKDLALNDLDLMKMTVPDQASKYVEVLAKLAKSKYKEIAESNGGEDNLRKACLSVLTEWGIDYNYLETLETPVLWAMWNRMETLLGQNNFKMFLKFANMNERKLLPNNDVTSYSSFDEIETAVSLAEIKLIDKELEKQVVKVYEDDEWLSIKPLSLEASMKYGASTKWCTTMDSGKYFAKYSKWGILIYNINKKTGFKFATFKNLSLERDREFSFWNMRDDKIDPLDTIEIPTSIIEVIRKEVNERNIPNSELMAGELRNKLKQYEDSEYNQPVDGARLHISGGFANIGSYTSSNTGTIGTIGMSTTTPNTQLSVNGDLEVRDGSIRMVDNTGVERARLTADGLQIPVYRGEEALEQALRGEQPDPQYRINESRERLQQLMDEMLNEANENVAEERAQQQTLLGDLELGALNEDYKRRMQILAGIDVDNIASPEPPVEEQAEQEYVPLVNKHRKSGKSWTNKLFKQIKSGYERITTKKDSQQPSLEARIDNIRSSSGN